MLHISSLLGRIAYSVHRAMSSVAKPIVIFVLGGPGAGKGTQCEKIVKVNKNFSLFCKQNVEMLVCKRGFSLQSPCNSLIVHIPTEF